MTRKMRNKTVRRLRWRSSLTTRRIGWCAVGGAGRQALVVDHLRDETPLERLGRGEPASRGHPLERSGRAEQAPNEVRAARVGHEADVDEGWDEGGAGGGEADVAGAGERKPGA